MLAGVRKAQRREWWAQRSGLVKKKGMIAMTHDDNNAVDVRAAIAARLTPSLVERR